MSTETSNTKDISNEVAHLPQNEKKSHSGQTIHQVVSSYTADQAEDNIMNMDQPKNQKQNTEGSITNVLDQGNFVKSEHTTMVTPTYVCIPNKISFLQSKPPCQRKLSAPAWHGHYKRQSKRPHIHLSKDQSHVAPVSSKDSLLFVSPHPKYIFAMQPRPRCARQITYDAQKDSHEPSRLNHSSYIDHEEISRQNKGPNMLTEEGMSASSITPNMFRNKSCCLRPPYAGPVFTESKMVEGLPCGIQHSNDTAQKNSCMIRNDLSSIDDGIEPKPVPSNRCNDFMFSLPAPRTNPQGDITNLHMTRQITKLDIQPMKQPLNEASQPYLFDRTQQNYERSPHSHINQRLYKRLGFTPLRNKLLHSSSHIDKMFAPEATWENSKWSGRHIRHSMRNKSLNTIPGTNLMPNRLFPPNAYSSDLHPPTQKSQYKCLSKTKKQNLLDEQLKHRQFMFDQSLVSQLNSKPFDFLNIPCHQQPSKSHERPHLSSYPEGHAADDDSSMGALLRQMDPFKVHGQQSHIQKKQFLIIDCNSNKCTSEAIARATQDSSRRYDEMSSNSEAIQTEFGIPVISVPDDGRVVSYDQFNEIVSAICDVLSRNPAAWKSFLVSLGLHDSELAEVSAKILDSPEFLCKLQLPAT